jgi:hypothetical protein
MERKKVDEGIVLEGAGDLDVEAVAGQRSVSTQGSFAPPQAHVAAGLVGGSNLGRRSTRAVGSAASLALASLFSSPSIRGLVGRKFT